MFLWEQKMGTSGWMAVVFCSFIFLLIPPCTFIFIFVSSSTGGKSFVPRLSYRLMSFFFALFLFAQMRERERERMRMKTNIKRRAMTPPKCTPWPSTITAIAIISHNFFNVPASTKKLPFVWFFLLSFLLSLSLFTFFFMIPVFHLCHTTHKNHKFNVAQRERVKWSLKN